MGAEPEWSLYVGLRVGAGGRTLLGGEIRLARGLGS